MTTTEQATEPTETEWLDPLGAAAETEPAPARELPMDGQVLLHVVGLGGDSSGPDTEGELRTETEDRELAMLVSSAMVGRGFAGNVLHRPVLDLDFSAHLVPSSSPGHCHLYIDRPMTWETYSKLLDALAEADLLESGYVGAAKRRQQTTVRVPWLRKGDPAPRWPEAEARHRLRQIERAPDETALDTLARMFGELWDDACTEAARVRLTELAHRRAEDLAATAGRRPGRIAF